MKVVSIEPRTRIAHIVGYCDLNLDLQCGQPVYFQRIPPLRIAPCGRNPLPISLDLAGNPPLRFVPVLISVWRERDGPIWRAAEAGWWPELAIHAEDGGPHPRWLPGWRPATD